MCTKKNLLEECKNLDEQEYKKALIKKAIDLEYDTSYFPLIAIALALLGIVFTNVDKLELYNSLVLTIGAIAVFLFTSFFTLFRRKNRILFIVDL